jgi:hypothetical protein
MDSGVATILRIPIPPLLPVTIFYVSLGCDFSRRRSVVVVFPAVA